MAMLSQPIDLSLRVDCDANMSDWHPHFRYIDLMSMCILGDLCGGCELFQQGGARYPVPGMPRSDNLIDQVQLSNEFEPESGITAVFMFFMLCTGTWPGGIICTGIHATIQVHVRLARSALTLYQ